MDSAGAEGNSGKLLDEMPPCSSDQEGPRRRSLFLAAKGSSYDGVMSRRMPQARSRSEFDATVSLWAALHPDILGIVLRFLPSLADRDSVRSVCRHWRTAAHGHVLPPPLPVLVLPEFRFSSLSDKGDLMAVRRVPVPKEVGADDLRCVGSFDGWLVGVTPAKNHSDLYYRNSDGECVLVNAYSHKVVNGASSVVHICANDTYTMSLCQAVLSASPDSGSKYIVAASSNYNGSRLLALWKPGMMSWLVCSGEFIDGPIDLTFYQGKLYVRHTRRLLTCELEDDDGFMVSRVELSLIELPFDRPLWGYGAIRLSMVVWRGDLLLIIRHYTDDCHSTQGALRVEVFALDDSTNPCELTEIHSFQGDCIFVGSSGCESFPAGLHDGVEGDLIYVPEFRQPHDMFVYSMRDGRMRPFAGQLLASFFDVPVENLDFPVWLLPTE